MSDDESKLIELVEELELRLKWTLRARLMAFAPVVMMGCFIVMAFLSNERWVMWVFIGASIVSGMVAKFFWEQRLRLGAILSAAKKERDSLRGK